MSEIDLEEFGWPAQSPEPEEQLIQPLGWITAETVTATIIMQSFFSERNLFFAATIYICPLNIQENTE